jgi:hypothetical protein
VTILYRTGMADIGLAVSVGRGEGCLGRFASTTLPSL